MSTEQNVETDVVQTEVPTAKVEEVQLSATEEVAYNQGWRPKTEFQGDPEDWRPAREWLERGEFLSKIKRMGREMDDMKRGYHNLYQMHLQSVKEANQTALARLRAERKAAHEDGDIDKVEELNEQISDMKAATRQEVQHVQQNQQRGPSPEYLEWIARNRWYETDEEMRVYADAYVLRILEKEGPQAPTEFGHKIEQAIRKQFPHKFKRVVGPPDPDGGGAKSGSNGNSTKHDKFAEIEKSMSATERNIMETFVKQKLMTRDEYLKDYADARS